MFILNNNLMEEARKIFTEVRNPMDVSFHAIS